MTKLRLAGVLTAIALLVALMGSALTVSAQGVTVLTGYVTFSGDAAPAGTQVRVVDADGNVVASSMTGRDGLGANQYRIDISLTAGDPLAGATVSLQALTGGGLQAETWAPAAGAVTAQVAAGQVVMTNIETDTAAPGPGLGGISAEELEAFVLQVIADNNISLRGPQGPPGRNGTDGSDGMDGADGEAGAPGDAGPIGPRGATGGIGPQGVQGETGPAGSNGSDGVAGPRGPTGNAGPAGPEGPQGNHGQDGSDGATGPAGAAGEDAGSALSVIALIIAIVAAIAAGAGVMMSRQN